MLILVTAEIPALKSLIEHVFRSEHPDTPFLRGCNDARVSHHQQLLKRVGDWVEVAMLLSVPVADGSTLEVTTTPQSLSTDFPDEVIDTSWPEIENDSGAEDMWLYSFNAHGMWEDEYNPWLDLVCRELHQKLMRFQRIAEVVSITPIDAEGTAMVTLNQLISPLHTHGVSYAQYR